MELTVSEKYTLLEALNDYETAIRRDVIPFSGELTNPIKSEDLKSIKEKVEKIKPTQPKV